MALQIRTDIFNDNITLTENIQEDSEIFIQNEVQSKKRNLDKKIEPMPKTRKLSSEEEGVRFSNDMKDAVKTVCQICKNAVLFQKMRLHSKAVHSLGITEYKMQYGGLDESLAEVVYHKCGICSDTFLLHWDAILAHSKKHDISLKEYSKRFLRLVTDTAPTLETTENETIGLEQMTIEELMAKSEDLKRKKVCKEATKEAEQGVSNKIASINISTENLHEECNGTSLDNSVDNKDNNKINVGEPVSIFSQFKERMERLEGEGRLTSAKLQGFISMVNVASISETLNKLTKRLQYLGLLEMSLHKWHQAQRSQVKPDADKTEKTFQMLLKEIQDKAKGAQEIIDLKNRLINL